MRNTTKSKSYRKSQSEFMETYLGNRSENARYVELTMEYIVKSPHDVMDDLTLEYHMADIVESSQVISQDEIFDQSYREAFQAGIATGL